MQTLREKVLAEQYSTPGVILGFFGPHRFLSNYHLCSLDLCPLMFEGLAYPSSENAFQAAKVAPENRGPFVNCTPSEAKKMGKIAKMNMSVQEWDKIKASVMKVILMTKFKQYPLKEMLLATYPSRLVETNWWGDKFWGVCEGVGENTLGKTLEEIRELYRKEL